MFLLVAIHLAGFIHPSSAGMFTEVDHRFEHEATEISQSLELMRLAAIESIYQGKSPAESALFKTAFARMTEKQVMIKQRFPGLEGPAFQVTGGTALAEVGTFFAFGNPYIHVGDAKTALMVMGSELLVGLPLIYRLSPGPQIRKRILSKGAITKFLYPYMDLYLDAPDLKNWADFQSECARVGKHLVALREEILERMPEAEKTTEAIKMLDKLYILAKGVEMGGVSGQLGYVKRERVFSLLVQVKNAWISTYYPKFKQYLQPGDLALIALNPKTKDEFSNLARVRRKMRDLLQLMPEYQEWVQNRCEVELSGD